LEIPLENWRVRRPLSDTAREFRCRSEKCINTILPCNGFYKMNLRYQATPPCVIPELVIASFSLAAASRSATPDMAPVTVPCAGKSPNALNVKSGSCRLLAGDLRFRAPRPSAPEGVAACLECVETIKKRTCQLRCPSGTANDRSILFTFARIVLASRLLRGGKFLTEQRSRGSWLHPEQ
jgi:hypothetical protein